MALFHFTVTQTKRSKGQSAIASAAYRSGEKLYSEYYGEYSDYTRKRGVICSDILLPPHAPKEYADRQTLWNAVEKAERGKNAQLAYSFEISLQNEFSLEENIALAREFLFREFVSRGMTVDVSFHEKECEDGGTPNPHFHFLCPIRPMEQDGTWGIKQRREYVLDEEGNRIRDANGKYVFNAVPTTDWGSPETLEHWREAWAEMCNAKFAEKGLDVRIANALMEKEIPVHMTNFALILNDLAASFENRNEYISRLCRYPLLILDDFGMERGTEYGLEQVFNVIDSRYRSGKPLIVTTNLTLDDLRNPEDTAHSRIYDRLLSMCVPVRFTGDNFRQEAAQRKMESMKKLITD